ncbi:STAS domain-containing protein [Phenylobacterium sp. SCN 70-31]|uniref:STAS domain-containing protein n=1 Tax=Phenylobacterium sp. SCN 70-31 TaxID=1660129 RepID=UPI00086DDAF4|nr:STAS domain-containing protein [Phenylobacterium sp. SCN 70-31]ODT89379.1 MAG: anti-anti-sigma factor [Phenylobacterium sp. SCN 70-31]
MQITEQTRDGVLVVALDGRLDSNTSGALEAVLPARIQAHERVVLDLAQVPYVSSAGLRVLLIGAKAARAGGRKFALSGLTESVREVFDISGFTSIFTLAADVEDAIVQVA